MATVGSIVVELQANTAQFHQEMGRASGSLDKVREGAGRSERALVSFAARGIGVVVPEAEGAAHALLRIAESATKASGAFAILAKTGLLAGVAVGAFLVGQKLREEIDNWLQLGETSKQTLDRIKQEVEDNQKFLEKRAATVALMINLEGKLAEARAKASEASTKTATGEATPESLGAALEARIAAIDTAQKLEEANIRKTIALGVERDKALTASLLTANANRIVATQEYYASVNKLSQDSAKKELDLFTSQTNAMLDSLKRRLDLRKSIEDEANTAAQRQGFGDLFTPFTQADTARQDAEKIAKGFALLIEQGKRFTDVFPEVIRLDQEFQSRGFIGFALAFENAQKQIRELGLDAQSIEQSFGSLSARLGSDLPSGISRAIPEVAKLAQTLDAMKLSADSAASSITALAQTIAGTPAPSPQVTAPVDLGTGP
jgi:hypothetical protein